MGVSTIGMSCGMPQAQGAPTPATSRDATSLVPVLVQLTQALTQLVTALATQSQGALAVGQGQYGAAANAPDGEGCCGGTMGAATGAQIAGAGAAPLLDSHADPVVQTPDLSSLTDRGSVAAREATQHLGKPYSAGAAGPASFDCSGLTMEIYRRLGINLPHKAALQAQMGTKVGRGDLRPGDLVFFSNAEKGVHHVGIYIGNDQFIHAPKTGDVVKVSSLNERYYAREFSSGSRFV